MHAAEALAALTLQTLTGGDVAVALADTGLAGPLVDACILASLPLALTTARYESWFAPDAPAEGVLSFRLSAC